MEAALRRKEIGQDIAADKWFDLAGMKKLIV